MGGSADLPKAKEHLYLPPALPHSYPNHQGFFLATYVKVRLLGVLMQDAYLVRRHVSTHPNSTFSGTSVTGTETLEVVQMDSLADMGPQPLSDLINF